MLLLVVLCRTCGYSLYGLTERSCPECSTPFNPSDPSTFHTGAERAQRKKLLALSCVAAAPPWLTLIGGHAALMIARLSLGRWPNRMGADDPGSIHWVALPILVFAVGWLLLIPGLIASIGVVTAVASSLGVRAAVRRFLVLLLSWLVALTLVRLDPAQVGVWIMD